MFLPSLASVAARPCFLLVLALCCRSTCQFRGNSEKSNHMLSATSHIGLEFLTKFLNMSKLKNRSILLYQSLPLQMLKFLKKSYEFQKKLFVKKIGPFSGRIANRLSLINCAMLLEFVNTGIFRQRFFEKKKRDCYRAYLSFF